MIIDLENQIKNDCRFCNPPDTDRILHETDNFYIMLSLGPIVEGYTLLVSKKHISCCGELPYELMDEFIFLYKKIKQILKDEYGSCISYEHGKAGSCLVPTYDSKHCFHSHMHFIPIDININNLINSDFDNSITFENLIEFRNYQENNITPYLFAEDTIIKLYPDIYNVRSQYLRFITANEINKNELWDWVKHQGWDTINSAKAKLKSKFLF